MNARLIAAAPDLLAALEDQQRVRNHEVGHINCEVDCCPDWASLWDIADASRTAAIAKAKNL